MKKLLKIVGIGEILWDVLPEGKRLGGAPGNFAYHAKKLGAEAVIISAVGNDDNGKEILNELSEKDILTELIQVNDKPTGTVDITLDDNGIPTYTIHENVAWDFILYNESVEQIAGQADIICFGTLAQRNDNSRETIEQLLKNCSREALIVYDVNLRQDYFSSELIKISLQHCNVLKLNEEELPVVCKLLEIGEENETDQLKKLIEEYKLKLAAFTKGSDGSLLLTPSEESYLSTPVVKVRDTVGAGDSFTAAMIVGFAQGDPLINIHRKAVEISAYVCTQNGAMPEYK